MCQALVTQPGPLALSSGSETRSSQVCCNESSRDAKQNTEYRDHLVRDRLLLEYENGNPVHELVSSELAFVNDLFSPAFKIAI